MNPSLKGGRRDLSKDVPMHTGTQNSAVPLCGNSDREAMQVSQREVVMGKGHEGAPMCWSCPVSAPALVVAPMCSFYEKSLD